MTDQNSLEKIVTYLMALSKEGNYWDFKQERHSDNGTLVHDIICLANANHVGDRYLIFGVSDDCKTVVDMNNDKPRFTQANLLSILKNNQNKFARGRYPDIRLETIYIQEKEIDVLIIKDLPQKPYYLVEQYNGMKPHHIYTRVEDTNTARNKSANPHDIEQMWRERFGLNLTPLNRVQIYLGHFDDWDSYTQDTGNILWFHKVFPEFTVRVMDQSDQTDLEWTLGEVSQDRKRSDSYGIYYHQTRLRNVPFVSFDDAKKSMVSPEWVPRDTGRFYYYERDSLKHALQLFHASKNGGDYSRDLTIRSKTLVNDQKKLTIPVIQPSVLKRFLDDTSHRETSQVCTDKDEQYEIFLKNHFDFMKWSSPAEVSPRNKF